MLFIARERKREIKKSRKVYKTCSQEQNIKKYWEYRTRVIMLATVAFPQRNLLSGMSSTNKPNRDTKVVAASVGCTAGESDSLADNGHHSKQRELEYRNKILQFKWEIFRKRFLSQRLWQATNDGK